MPRSLSIAADEQIPFVHRALSDFSRITLLDGHKINKRSIKDADALLVRSITPVNETLLDSTPIRFVGSATSGIDHVDLGYLEKAGIKFAHAPGSNARAVAEYVLSSLFAIAELRGFSLTDKTVGIVGCGHTGSRLASFLRTLGVNCLLNDPPLVKTGADGPYVDLIDIFDADIISLHVPLSYEGNFATYGMVNDAFLSRLKKNVILINTSRGEVVDENSLITFKHHNPEAILILDVWRNEPGINPELLQQTLLATPHIAGYSLGSKIRAGVMLLRALAAFFGLKTDVMPFSDPFPAEKGGLIELEKLEEDAIRCAVMRSYDIRSDAVVLRHLVNLPTAEQGRYYDSLRKNYPLRHEFTDFLIRARDIDEDTASRLGQLGFSPDIAA